MNKQKQRKPLFILQIIYFIFFIIVFLLNVLFLDSWLSIISLTIFVLLLTFLYKKYKTNYYKTYKKIEKWLLGTVAGVVMLGWVSTYIYGKIVPGDFKILSSKIDKSVKGIDSLKDGQADILVYLKKMAETQKTSIDDLKKENEQLKEKIKNGSLINLNPKLQKSIDTLINIYKYDSVIKMIENYISNNKNITIKELSRLEYQKAISYNGLYNYEKAEKSLSLAYSLDKNNSDIATEYAETYFHLNNLKKSLSFYQLALKIDKNKFGKFHNKVSEDYLRLGLAYRFNEKDKKAYHSFLEALKISIKNNNLESVAEANNNIGLYFGDKGNISKSIKYFKDALKYNRKAKDTISIAVVLVNIGTANVRENKFDIGIKHIDEALNLLFVNFERNRMNIAKTHLLLANALHQKGLNSFENKTVFDTKSNKYDYIYNKSTNTLMNTYFIQSMQHLVEALNIYEKVYDYPHIDIAHVYNLMGLNCLEVSSDNSSKSVQEKYRNLALDYFKNALSITSDTFNKPTSFALTIYENIAVIWLLKENYNKAIDNLEKALKIRNEKEINSTDLDYASLYDNLGNALLLRNSNSIKGYNFVKKAIKIYKKYYPNDNPRIRTLLEMKEEYESQSENT